MNTSNTNLLANFSSESNKSLLQDRLTKALRGTASEGTAFDINDFMTVWRRRAEKCLGFSEPIPGITMQDEINALNNAFIADRVEFIRFQVVGEGSQTLEYSVSDGAMTTKSTVNRRPDELLNDWKISTGTSCGMTMREDTGGDVHGDAYAGKGRSTGITFNDVSKQGQNQHMEQLFNPAFVRMNAGAPIYGDAFGTDFNEKALMQKKSRDPSPRFYERAIGRRHIDRDVTEGLRGGEGREGLTYANDMSSLYKRLDARRATPTMGHD